jgi:2-polyprenyl-3-methyl-5-hydroxy-6-metoxy-1,4-benzoquinol methylase
MKNIDQLNESQANIDDVVSAYRIFLGRNPDSAGLATYQSLIQKGELTLEQLFQAFTTAPEFKEKHSHRPTPTQMPPVSLKEQFKRKVSRRLNRFLRKASGQTNAAINPLPLNPEIKILRSPSELDAMLAHCDAMMAQSVDEYRKAAGSFHYVPSEPYPDDPHSQAYRDFQAKLYQEISGRSNYGSLDNEESPFDLEQAKRSPYPYQTESALEVGNQLIAQGFLLKTANLQPGAKVLEFGPGWGNTTLHMLTMGYELTVVEADEKFISLIQHRAGVLNDRLTCHHDDMATFKIDQTFDAVLFFECFHHCSDHLTLLKNLDAMLGPDGVMIFAAEPIIDFPYPWGVRLDGISVHSIRKFGWLELGFDTTYFQQTLNDLGWTFERHQMQMASPIADVIIARRQSA